MSWANYRAFVKLAEDLAPLTRAVNAAIDKHDATEGLVEVLAEPGGKRIFVSNGDWAEYDIQAFLSDLRSIKGVEEVDAEAEHVPPECRDWVKVAKRQAEAILFSNSVKQAYSSPFLRGLSNAMQLTRGTGNLPGGPSQLKALLAGSLLLGGGGWLGGKLLKTMAPDHYGDNLPTTLGLAGAAAGALPALGVGVANRMAGRNFFDSSLYKTSSMGSMGYAPYVEPSFNAPLVRQELWNDPYLSRQLSPQQAGALAGAVTAAELQNKSPIITASDMGRLAIGLGSGYAQGAMVGSALSLVFGLPEEARTALKQTGAVAGVIKSVVPMLFGPN